MNTEPEAHARSERHVRPVEGALTLGLALPPRSQPKAAVGERAWRIGRFLWLAGLLLLGGGLLAGSWQSTPPQPRPTPVAPVALSVSASQKIEKPKSRPTTGWRRIEEVRVGQRVVGRNPLRVGFRLGAGQPGNEPEPRTWRQVRVRLVKSNGRILKAVLLRPLKWLQANGVRVGGTVRLNLPEMSVVGTARVLAIEPCPAIERGPGQVVTATFCHEPSNDILDVWVGDQKKPIGVTIKHPWWSEDRQAFVAVGQMKVGERVRTRGAGG